MGQPICTEEIRRHLSLRNDPRRCRQCQKTRQRGLVAEVSVLCARNRRKGASFPRRDRAAFLFESVVTWCFVLRSCLFASFARFDAWIGTTKEAPLSHFQTMHSDSAAIGPPCRVFCQFAATLMQLGPHVAHFAMLRVFPDAMMWYLKQPVKTRLQVEKHFFLSNEKLARWVLHCSVQLQERFFERNGTWTRNFLR